MKHSERKFLHSFQRKVLYSIQIEWVMIVVPIYLSILKEIDFDSIKKIERKTVTTIISHSMLKELEI